MSELGNIFFAIVLFGSMLLTPLCLLFLAVCCIGMIAGQWNAKGFADRWVKGRKMIIGFSIPPLIFLISIILLENSRTFPNGYRIVYMHSSACNLVDANSIVVIDEHILEKTIATNGNIVSGQLANGKTFALNTATGLVTYNSNSRQTLANETASH